MLLRISRLIRKCSQLCLAFVLSLPLAAHAQIRTINAANSSVQDHTYSPAVDAGDYIYISGQGRHSTSENAAKDFSADFRQALENVKVILQSNGLTLDHVVYTEVYLEDIAKTTK
jgi:2-iminobutanoate/2-iminopropanoate deaminase